MSPQPTPTLLNATGHSLLRSIVAGQSDHLLAAADAIAKLDKLLPNASAEARLTAVLIMMASDHPSPPVASSPAPTPAPTRRKSKPAKQAKTSRRSKAATPRMDASGKLLSSREISGVAVVSQAEARKSLGMSCLQMIKLENQKLLGRIQESGSRLVYYSVAEVQKLLNLIDRGGDPKPDADDAPTDAMA